MFRAKLPKTAIHEDRDMLSGEYDVWAHSVPGNVQTEIDLVSKS